MEGTIKRSLRMDIASILTNLTKGDVADSIGQTTGTDRSQVESVIAAGLPIILGQLGNNTSDKSGAKSLDTALAKDHSSGSLLENLIGAVTKSDVGKDGTKILDHIFGSQQKTANEQVSKKTGVDAATVAKILALLAPIVMAYLGRKKTEDNLDAGGVSDVLKQQKDTDGSPLTDVASAILGNQQVRDMLGGLFGKR